MPIDKNEIEKYIFDPQSPKSCKSYQLLLNIAKEECFVYVDSNYMSFVYRDTILNDDFFRKLWDKPQEFDKQSLPAKIAIFKSLLSGNDYINHINSLKIDKDTSIYSRLFNSFFDLNITSVYIQISQILDQYGEDQIKAKLREVGYNQDYSMLIDKHGSIKTPIASNKHKILFTDNLKAIEIDHNFYNISSLIITDIKNSSAFTSNKKINPLVKPIFLKKIEDLDLLLNVLENDLRQTSSGSIAKKDIPTIDSIKVENFFSMKSIELNSLKERREIYIVGENGDGKTLLLQAITIALAGVKEGDVFDLVKEQNSYHLSISDSQGGKYNQKSDKPYNNILAYGASRNNYCQIKDDEVGYLSLFSNEYDLKSPIKWLQYLDYSEKTDKINIITVKKAKELLRHLLNSDIEIKITPDAVQFTERGSVVSFDQLSAGYKGVITIICDLIARLSETQQVKNIADFQGVVLIDEVELHLHPKWKYNFMQKLREAFPLVQFIVTTHSPTVILGASKEAVFYKIYKDDGEVQISNQIPNRGYTNNTLISSPLFDLDTMTSRHYDNRKLSEDDFVYEKIHDVVSQKIKKDVNLDEDAILELIEKEFAEHEKN